MATAPRCLLYPPKLPVRKRSVEGMKGSPAAAEFHWMRLQSIDSILCSMYYQKCSEAEIADDDGSLDTISGRHRQALARYRRLSRSDLSDRLCLASRSVRIAVSFASHLPCRPHHPVRA